MKEKERKKKRVSEFLKSDDVCKKKKYETNKNLIYAQNRFRLKRSVDIINLIEHAKILLLRKESSFELP